MNKRVINKKQNQDLLEAYIELWAAVENGELKDKFFDLRARFRHVVQGGEA